MPELPEVETIRRNLEQLVVGQRVSKISPVTHPRSLRFQPGGWQELHDCLGDRVFGGAVRRGKYLWLPLEDSHSPQRSLVIHLGMSGQLRVIPWEAKALPQERLRLGLEGGDALVFCDQRTFGHLEVVALRATSDGLPGGKGSDSAAIPETVAHIARDVLDPHRNLDSVGRLLKGSGRAIKTQLLNQEVISGIGNIYADEGLFAAGIHPATVSKTLSSDRLEELFLATADVMERAIDLGGTSFDELYVDSWGNPGLFASYLQVYGRAGKFCTQCGETLSRISIDQRSSVYCAQCQQR